MAIDQLPFTENLVTWTLSGTYDEDKPVREAKTMHGDSRPANGLQLLLDADEPSRYLTKRRITQLVARLAGAFGPHETICTHLSNDVRFCNWMSLPPSSLY